MHDFMAVMGQTQTAQVQRAQSQKVPKQSQERDGLVASAKDKSFHDTLKETAKDIENAEEKKDPQSAQEAAAGAMVAEVPAEPALAPIPTVLFAELTAGLAAGTQGAAPTEETAAAVPSVQNRNSGVPMSAMVAEPDGMQAETPKQPIPVLTENAKPEVAVTTASTESMKQNGPMPAEKAMDVKQPEQAQTSPVKQDAGQAETVKIVEAKSGGAETQGKTDGEEGQRSETLKTALPAGNEPVAEKLVVKVSDGKTVAQPEKFTADVGEKILFHASEGKQEFDIELTPAELGKINIKLVFEGGKASILYHCSNPQTQQALAANAEQLRHIIEAGTGRPTEVTAREDTGGMTEQRSDQRGENEARDELEQRMMEGRRPRREEVSDFMERFRLGLETERPTTIG